MVGFAQSRAGTVVVAVVAVSVAAVQADTIYVDANCPGGDGSELDPYCSIQTAIDVAVDMDEILVAPGTYFETINFLGKSITLRSSGGAEVTIIDAVGNYHVVQCLNGEGPDTVLDGFTITGGNANAGFPNSVGGGMNNRNSSSPTVTNCIFSGNSAISGGGMYNRDNSSPTVTNCTFSGNSASSSGGGMSVNSSSPTVTNCIFSGNSGSGMSVSGSSPTVTNCTFSGNSGGGMHNSSGSPTVTNCIFSGNSAARGGGMYNLSATPTVTNCTFSGNFADLGGGMCNGGGSPTVTNCTFSGNWADSGGGGMFNTSGSPTVNNCTFSGNIAGNLLGGGGIGNFTISATVTNCVLWGNIPDEIGGGLPAAVNYSDIAGGYLGTGNINADPLFANLSNCCFSTFGQGCDDSACEATVCAVDPFCCDFFWTIDCVAVAIDLCGDLCVGGDLRLSPGSPCIDAGHNNAIAGLTDTDLDGNPRFADDPDTDDTGCGVPVIVDMGAYEYQGLPAEVVFADLNGDGFVGIADLMILRRCVGSGDPDCCSADLDLDGEVGMSDRLLAWASIMVEFSPVR